MHRRRIAEGWRRRPSRWSRPVGSAPGTGPAPAPLTVRHACRATREASWASGSRSRSPGKETAKLRQAQPVRFASLAWRRSRAARARGVGSGSPPWLPNPRVGRVSTPWGMENRPTRQEPVVVIPRRDDQAVDRIPALRFAAAARRLGDAARAAGLDAPAFRSPPGISTARRTIRRYPGGGAVGSVRLRGRRFARIAGDMVEGVLVANRVSARAAPRLRSLLRTAALSDRSDASGVSAAA